MTERWKELGLPKQLVTHVPRTPAGRMALVMELYAPTYEDGVDDNGDPIIKRGLPLISLESALELLAYDDSAGWDANGSPVL